MNLLAVEEEDVTLRNQKPHKLNRFKLKETPNNES